MCQTNFLCILKLLLFNVKPNKLRIFLTVIITLTAFESFNCQIFGLRQTNPEQDYLDALSYPKDNKYRVINIKKSQSNQAINQFQLLVYDSLFALNDSINYLSGVYLSEGEPLVNNHKIIWPCIIADSTNLSGPIQSNQLALNVMDTNYRNSTFFKIGPIESGLSLAGNIVKINKHYYVSKRKFGTGSIIYKLNLQFIKTDSLVLTGAGLLHLDTFSNGLIATSSGTWSIPCGNNSIQSTTPKKIVIDTNFIVQNCFALDSLSNTINIPGVPFYGKVKLINESAKVVPLTNHKYIAIGNCLIPYGFGLSTYCGVTSFISNSTNQILKTNFVSRKNKNVSYVGNGNFLAIKQNEIVTIADIDYDYQANNFAQNKASKMLLTKYDTLGNVLFQKEYGGDMFYVPFSIVYTKDGGMLISGRRYDSTNTQFANITQSFLLKLDANGNYNSVGIKENNRFLKNVVTCFPNPATKNIIFDVPFEENIILSIHDLLGREVILISDYKNYSIVDLTLFDAGTYIYQIKTSNHFYTGRFYYNK